MNIGHTRVSTEDQNPDLQLATLEADCGISVSFLRKRLDTCPMDRTEKCLKTLAASDIIIISKLDSLKKEHCNE